MIRFFLIIGMAGAAIAQTPAVLGKVTIRTVTCEISETLPRGGIAYSCTQAAADGSSSPVASGTLVPVTASVTTTITAQSASATAGAPPDQNTFAITANKTGSGVSGSPIVLWNVSINGTYQP